MKILAVDLGLKRIGVAYSPMGEMAIPLEPIIRQNRNQAANAISALITMYEIDTVVFGVANDEMERRVAHFANLLQTTAAIHTVDESSSTVEAKALGLGEFGKSGKLDSLSAMVILERYIATINQTKKRENP